jgi:hypothetical protein
MGSIFLKILFAKVIINNLAKQELGCTQAGTWL